MRCVNWPDSTCRAPVACDGFGYCRERNFNFFGEPLNPEPYAEVWRQIDDDGKPAGNTYAERGRIDMIEPPPHPALRSMNAADFAAHLVRLSYAESGELEDALLEAAMRIDERQNWLCPECQCQINDADGVTSCPNCGWSEEDD